MIASGTIPVNFLQHDKIRVSPADQISHFRNRRKHTLLVFCPGKFTAVHKETVVPCISSETDIVSHDHIFFILSDLKILQKIIRGSALFDF